MVERHRANGRHVLGLILVVGVTACQGTKDDLDSDSPWPVDGGESDGGGSGGTGVLDTGDLPDDTGVSGIPDSSTPFDGEVQSVESELPPRSGDEEEPSLTVAVLGSRLEVSHTYVELAPCADFAVTGFVNNDALTIEASYQNASCGDPVPTDIVWSMTAPTEPGEWTLWVGTETAALVIE